MTHVFIFICLLLAPLWAAATPYYTPQYSPRQTGYQQPIDPRYIHTGPAQPSQTLEDVLKRVLTNPRTQELTYQNFARFLLQQGVPHDMITEVEENLAKQKPLWQQIVVDCLPPEAVKSYLNGERIYPIADVYTHLQKAQQSRKPVSWDVNLIGTLVIQYVDACCNRPKVDLKSIQRDFQSMLRIVPSQYHDDLGLGVLLEKLESSMVWQSLMEATKQYVSSEKWFKELEVKKNIFKGKKSPKKPRDPWEVQTFEKEKFNSFKDEKIKNLWRNLQGVSGNFDIVSRSIISEITELSREEVAIPLYQKNMMAFMRGIAQQFQDQVQQAPLGVCAWLYDQIDPSLRSIWQSGPHFQPNAFQQWRGDKENIDTLSVDGIQLALLAGIRDIEAKNAQRAQKIQEITRFLDAWKQRFQSMPKIVDVIQAVEMAADDIVEKITPWPILAQISEQNMTAKGYQALIKEFPKLIKKPMVSGWGKVRKIKRPMILPWGKENADQLQKVTKPENNRNNDVLSQLTSQLFSQSSGATSGGAAKTQGASSNGSSLLNQTTSNAGNNSKVNNNKLLQDGIKQFVGALGLKI